MLCTEGELLGCRAQYLQAKQAFARCNSGKKGVQWLKAYRDLNRFRTSLPSVEVHDFSEMHRRSGWNLGDYEADLRTLLKRAKGIAWNEELQKVTIRGIGKLRRVHASEIFDEDDCGQILETRNYKDEKSLRLYQDGESTPVSELMAHRNHIFAVVPRRSVEADLDWRLPVFESGKFLIAFDGAALLLTEMARRTRPSSPG